MGGGVGKGGRERRVGRGWERVRGMIGKRGRESYGEKADEFFCWSIQYSIISA